MIRHASGTITFATRAHFPVKLGSGRRSAVPRLGDSVG